jgi:hypothetical protein
MSQEPELIRGQRITVRCLLPVVHNRAEGITMWQKGDTAEIVVTGFWEGMIEQGRVCVCDPPQAVEAVPETPVTKGHKPGCKCVVCKRKG